MSEDKLERISALMDGELDSRERDIAIENIEVDPETMRSWQRYHIIGDTMRNTMPATVKPDLAIKLNEMLENEPTFLSPKPSPKSSDGRKGKFISKDFTKPLAGLAVAASVTAVAIFSLQNSEQHSPSLENGVAQVARISINSNQITPIDANIDFAPMTESSIGNAIPSAVRTVKYEPVENTLEAKHLNPYILNHNQVNSRLGVQGVSPGARLVGHESR